jgi:outer membrane protein
LADIKQRDRLLKKNPILKNLTFGVAALGLLSGCSQYHVTVDNQDQVDNPLPAYTGVDTDLAKAAAQKTTLDLWDVYALAVERTESMAITVDNLELADALQQQALGTWLPQVYLNAQKNWVSGSFVESGQGNDLATNSAGDSLYLSGAETILSGLNQVAAIQGAKDNINAAEFGLRDAASRLLLNVAQAFYSVLELQDTLQTDTASQDLTQKILDVQKNWVAIGRAQKSDMLTTTAQLAQLDATIQNDKTQLTQERETLAFLAGIKPDTPLQSTDENYAVPSFSLDDAQSKVDGRPDVLEAKANLAAAAATVLQAHGEHLPSIVAVGDYYLAADGSNNPHEWNVGLEASLPVFEGGQIVAQEREADARRDQAKLAWSQTRRSALEEIRQVYKGLGDSIQQTAAYQNAMDASQSAYDAVLHDYKLNLQTPLTLLQTLNSLETAKADYVKTKYQTLYDQVWLGVATGDLPKVPESNGKQ